jgi:hypothetical protein
VRLKPQLQWVKTTTDATVRQFAPRVPVGSV